MTEKPILAFDCSTPEASVALRAGGTNHARRIPHGRQAAELVSAIDGLMREHAIAYGALGAIVTTLGPGSFTGLRIALATLHGLVLAVPVPVKTLTSPQAVAWDIARRAGAPREFVVALNAGKGELFRQRFGMENGIPVPRDGIALVKPDALAGETLPVFGNMLPAGDARYVAGPSASVLCAIAAHLAETPLAGAQPLYIRPPDAKIPAKPLWLADAVNGSI